ncbi:MAG: DUF1007 family protein [Natronohydrobacter sp.]|nr:DUF1007 family protein [Natronohydrobacter sp.]
MRHLLIPVVLSCASFMALPARAHPHIFVDVGLELVFDEAGQAEGVWISWTYDPFFSMLLVSDMGLDADFTGTISDEEREALHGFDMNWTVEEYHGDTHVTQNGQPLALSGPVEWESDYRDGQLHSRHLRHLIDRPDPAREWVVVVYDPTYYTAYGLIGMPRITGRTDCTARVFEPDWEAAGAQLEAALDEVLGAGGDIEADFPMVGALFSEEVRVLCAAP